MRAGGPKLDSLDNLSYGLHYGIVCQNKDPEKLDRIKIRLPWLDHGNIDQTHWAQLVTPMEGKNYGWYNLPEIDDVVIVMFIGGDASQPVILGGIWSKPDFAPEPNKDGKNNFRGYRSRSGHRLILDDTAKTKVVFADRTGKNMVGVGNFAMAGTGPNKCAVYKPPMSGESGISISSVNGSLEITAGGALNVSAGGKVMINAGSNMDVKAGTMDVGGGSGAKLSAGTINVDAGVINIL